MQMKNQKWFLKINNFRNDDGRNNLGKKLVKDINGENIIYEITVKIKEEYNYLKQTGIGLVHNYRDGELLIVNFDNNNIISHNLQDLSIFIDEEEFNMNKNIIKDPTNDKNNTKKFMNDRKKRTF